MGIPTDLTDKKFGRLTAIKRLDRVSKKRGYYWLCQCECGNFIEVTVSHLNGGNTKSCGCIRKRPRKRPSKITVNNKNENWEELFPELIHLRSVVVEDGLFRVFEDSTILRKSSRGISKAAKIKTGRNGRYYAVTGMVNGKQKHFYVHRLVGEAFIPKESNGLQINHKDGNGHNNLPSNLEWVTPAQNVQHAYDTGLNPTLKNIDNNCEKCKNPTFNSGLCTSCKAEMKVLKNRLKSRKAKKEKLRESFRNVHLYKPLYQKVIKSRFRGDTLEEVGDRFGFTREYIRQLENNVIEKKPKVFRSIASQNYGIINDKTFVKRNATPFKLTVKAARVNAGYTLNEVAMEIGMSSRTIMNWENGETKIPKYGIQTLSTFYDIPPEYLKIESESGWYRAR